MLKIVEKKKIWFTISILIIVIGFGFMFTKGMNFGIDFRGGTQVVINMGTDFNKTDVDKIVDEYSKDAVTNQVNGTELQIKAKELNSSQVNDIFKALKEKYDLKDDALVSQNEIGASVGRDLTTNAIVALVIAVIGMLIYVVIRFEFSFGIAAIIALLHDVLITISVYAVFGITINTPFIAAILTIVGYSINGTIIIFDRIREQLKTANSKTNITELVNSSITSTMSRTVYTSITTLIMLIVLFIMGVTSVKEFTLPLIVGIVVGAYSSVCLTSAMWYVMGGKKRGVVEENNKKAASKKEVFEDGSQV